MNICDELRKRRHGALVISAQHTGTWFVLRFLLEHPNLSSLVQFKDLVGDNQKIGPGTIVHTHVPRAAGVSKDDLVAISHEMPVVVPVRDPMLACISREDRHPDLQHGDLVEGFCFLARLNAIFLPVDNQQNEIEREAALDGILRAFGLSRPTHFVRWVREWPMPNSHGSYPIKDLYMKGDMDKFFYEYPKMKDQLILLKQTIPFLQRIGYKPMPWWEVAC